VLADATSLPHGSRRLIGPTQRHRVYVMRSRAGTHDRDIMESTLGNAPIRHARRHAVACFLTRGDLYISWEHGAKVRGRPGPPRTTAPCFQLYRHLRTCASQVSTTASMRTCTDSGGVFVFRDYAFRLWGRCSIDCCLTPTGASTSQTGCGSLRVRAPPVSCAEAGLCLG
jgi:hypothetical protein